MPFRFVHTADVHLDAPLRSLALRDPVLADRIGAATRGAFARTVDLCLAEGVDALVVAGDLWDGAQGSMTTARFVRGEFARLHAAGIACYLVRGNHDHASPVAQGLDLPPSVVVFGPRGGVVTREAGALTVAVHGVSFDGPRAGESLLPRFSQPVAGAANVGILHTSLNGAAGHDPYAPCSLADLTATGFRYWALGHIHVRAEYPGPVHVVMPGCPQGRDMGEAGEKSVTLVTLHDGGRVTTGRHSVALARFERLALDLPDDPADWPARLRAAAAAALDAAGGAAVVARATLAAPPGDAGWRLRRDRAVIAAELSDAGLWVEGVDVAEAGQPAPGAGALDDLARIVADEVLGGPVFEALAARRLSEAEALLKGPLRGLLGDGPAAERAALRALAAEGAADVLAALRGGDG